MRRARTRKSEDSRRSGGTLRFILIVALAAWAIRSFVFAPFNIPSGSMLPSLYIGDYLVAAKWPYGYSRFSFPFGIPSFDGRIFSSLPERGDVVVFASRTPGAEDVVKRVIGLPGDMIELRGGELILNGRPVPRTDRKAVEIPLSPNSPCRRITPRGIGVATTQESTCAYPSYRETLPNGVSYRVIDQLDTMVADDFGPVEVPPGHLFMMGDNRDDSADSRFSDLAGGVGFLPIDHVIGRATFLFWSTDGSASYFKPWTWFTALRTERIGKGFTEEE